MYLYITVLEGCTRKSWWGLFWGNGRGAWNGRKTYSCALPLFITYVLVEESALWVIRFLWFACFRNHLTILFFKDSFQDQHSVVLWIDSRIPFLTYPTISYFSIVCIWGLFGIHAFSVRQNHRTPHTQKGAQFAISHLPQTSFLDYDPSCSWLRFASSFPCCFLREWRGLPAGKWEEQPDEPGVREDNMDNSFRFWCKTSKGSKSEKEEERTAGGQQPSESRG